MKTVLKHDRHGRHRSHKAARRSPRPPSPSRNTFRYALIGLVLLACIVLLWSWVIATLLAEGVL